MSGRSNAWLWVAVLLSATVTAQVPPSREAGRDRAEFDVLRDLAYVPAGHERQKLDLYLLKEAETKETIATSKPGVFLAGCCQSPKDIPDAVAQASGAAALACICLTHGGSLGDHHEDRCLHLPLRHQHRR